MPKKPAKKQPASRYPDGPLARTIDMIARGPRCTICDSPNQRGDHECRRLESLA
jgi:hypothetical protein